MSNIEIRSDEIQEVIGSVPSRIVRWGIGLVFSILVILIVCCCFFKYPEIIHSSIVITTNNPPAPLVAKIDGEIERILVCDKQKVVKGELLAIIDNTVDYNSIVYLRNYLDSLRVSLMLGVDCDFVFDENLEKEYSLGLLQREFTLFLQKYMELKHCVQLNYYNRKINSIKVLINRYKTYHTHLKQESVTLKAKYQLSTKQYSRDSLLLHDELISLSDFEKSRNKQLEKRLAYEEAKSELANTMIRIAELEQSVLEQQLRCKEQMKSIADELLASLDVFVGGIQLWREKFVFESPVEGIVSLTKVWSKNQHIKKGERVMVVIPDKCGNIAGRMRLPLYGSGKVFEGQQVNIKFHGFPYMEYGMVKGRVGNIAHVPDGNMYMVEVELPKGLQTSYGKLLSFRQEMQGAAEIITNDISLMQRFLGPLKSFFDN